MATDVRSQVTVDVVVNTAKATPALDGVKASLQGIEQVQNQINETADKMAANIPRSLAEVRAAAEAHGGNIWNLPVRGEAQVVPDVAPAAQAQVKEAVSALDTIERKAQEVWGKIKSGFSTALEGVVATAKRIGATLGPIFETWVPFAAGFAVTTVLDSFTSGMKELVDTVNKLGPQAKNIGITIQELQRITEWAKESGTPIKTITSGLEDLTKTLGAVAQGTGPGSKRAAKALADLLGEDWSAEGKSAIDVLREMSAAFVAIDDPQRRAADAAGIFTGKWKEMLPLLMQGPQAIDAAVETSKKLGEISPEMQKAADDYTAALAQFGTAWSSLKMEIGGAILPVLTPALKELTDFLAAHREEIAGFFKGAVEAAIALANAIGTIHTALDALEKGNWGDVLAAISPKDENVQRWKTWGDAMRDTVGKLPADPFTAPLKLAIETVDALAAAWRAVGEGIDKALEAWNRWKGVPATPPAAAAPTVVSPGGGPGLPAAPPSPAGGLTFEELTRPAPSILSPEALAGARGAPVTPPPPSGQVKVTIENKNPLPGQQVSAASTGRGVSTTVDRGVSMPWSEPPAYAGPWAPGAGA